MATILFGAVHLGVFVPVNIEITHNWSSHPGECSSCFEIGVRHGLLGLALECLNCVDVVPATFLVELVDLLLLLPEEALLWRTLVKLLLCMQARLRQFF